MVLRALGGLPPRLERLGNVDRWPTLRPETEGMFPRKLAAFLRSVVNLAVLCNWGFQDEVVCSETNVYLLSSGRLYWTMAWQTRHQREHKTLKPTRRNGTTNGASRHLAKPSSNNANIWSYDCSYFGNTSYKHREQL